MILQPPIATLTDTLFPDSTLFRSPGPLIGCLPEIASCDGVVLDFGDLRDTREEHVDADDVDQLDDLSRRIEGCDRAKDEVVDTHRFHDLPREGEQRLLAVVDHRIAEAIVGN